MTAALAVLSVLVAHAQSPDTPVNVPPAERTRGAERVVVGHVETVTPVWRTNDYGDRLIVSVVHVAVDETLKGAAVPAVDVEVEGGTIGTFTLRVSDLESFAPGDRAVFYLNRNRGGRLIPHRRGLGFQKLDRSGRVRGGTATLDELRRQIRDAARGQR